MWGAQASKIVFTAAVTGAGWFKNHIAPPAQEIRAPEFFTSVSTVGSYFSDYEESLEKDRSRTRSG